MKAVLVIALSVVATLVPVASASHNPTPSQNAALVYRTFTHYYGSAVGAEMVRCMWRESHGDEHASNWGDSHGGSFGLLQLNGVHAWRGESASAFRARMWNPVENVMQGVRLWRDARRYYGNGFQPWGGGC